MVEALIDLATGNVIVVKPLGSIWGKEEVNRVIKIDDPALALEINNKEHKVFPYAVIERVTIKDSLGNIRFTRNNMVVSSLVKVKVVASEIEATKVLKEGILTAADSVTPLATATISEVLAVPDKTDPGAEVLVTKDPLPAVKP
jgi:hypothetical protein